MKAVQTENVRDETE